MFKFVFWMSFVFFAGCSSSPSDAPESDSEESSAEPTAANNTNSEGTSQPVETPKKGVEVDLNQILKLKRNTPVFSKPSAGSRVLADAYADTVIILRRLSPKENWAFVEDEDGHKGWIPTNRTNWFELKTQKTSQDLPPETLPQAEALPPNLEEVLKSSEPYQETAPVETQQGLVPSVMGLHLDFNRKGRGLSFFYLAGSILQDKVRQKLDRTGIELQAMNLWGNQRISATKDPWVFGAAFRMLTQNLGSGLASGPSFGGLLRLDNRTWGPSLAYSAGFLSPDESAPFIQGRAAFEWIDWDMEFNFGVELGWTF